jgi:hypothetical protein
MSRYSVHMLDAKRRNSCCRCLSRLPSSKQYTVSLESFHTTMSPLFGLQRSLNSRDFLVERQDVRFWPDWRNREGVDLLVALGVMLLDVRELCGAAESIVVPIAMSNPSTATSMSVPNYCQFSIRTCELLGSHCGYRECCT